MKRIDLNVDLGEGFGFDDALLHVATSANVCLGAHAGSWDMTERTFAACRRLGVRAGLHPGFPDRHSMGREVPSPEQTGPYRADVARQMSDGLLRLGPDYVKPHGALYNLMASEDGGEWIDWFLPLCGRLPVVLLPTPALMARLGSNLVREGFADRAYGPDGRLVARTKPGAVLSDPSEIIDQALRLAAKVDTICLHGDTPGCVAFAHSVRAALEKAGFEVAAWA